MISEDHDAEDCSNDAENTALRHRNKLYFKAYKNRKPILEIAIRFHNITVFLMSRKNITNLTDPNW